ncbi:MAG: UvrD-helicase domain-containing protein [Bifidobacterium aquikefiri]|uniref:DNA 3'-5' helicase n=1 Tax=Bifidobacterium aquikefiri TaxID=1653207 RepID=A0A261G872_9BIFI|nr:ATP-dependent DNA helicase [Bifidobacterium aquikefiri]OZG67604.1 UvrD/REP helicase N-terminal domain-containing protein [Bifidobacterium aquikefiri]
MTQGTTAMQHSEKPVFTSTAEQQSIIEANINANQLIVAGAGSGKTMTMTMRIVRLIESGVSPERILGLTFTRKAASELLTRVSAAVIAHSNTGASIFLKPEVQTYDAFFQSIVRQYGLLVGFNQSTQPLSDAGAYQLAAEVVGEHIQSLFATQDAEAEDYEENSDAAVKGDAFSEERLLRKLAAATPSDADVASQSFSTTVNNVLAVAHACSNSMIDGSCTTFEQAAHAMHSWDSAFISRVNSILGGVEIPKADPSDKKVAPLDTSKKMSEKTRTKKLGEIQHNRDLRRAFRAQHLKTIAQNREVLLTLAEQYQEAKRKANMAEFSDFTLAAYQLVTRFPSIGAQYRRRFSHVFLDEYQDTSTTQALLIAALFHPDGDDQASQKPDSEAASTRRHISDRSAVSAVGDPFQSIYAWRGASPGAFRTFLQEFDKLSAQTAYTPTRQYSLSQTFRNGSLILDAANNLTLPLRQDRGTATSASMREVDVKPLRARDSADRGTLGLLATQTLDEEIQGVIRFVQESRHRYGVESTPSASAAASSESVDTHAPHVAILFRSKTNLPQYCGALHDAGLSYEVVGYSALLERPEIRDLRALLNVICNHTDVAALMRLLATPRFNVNPADLNAFAQMVKGINVESQYRGLVEAGLAPTGAKHSQMHGYVNQHRDNVPNNVFAIDVLMEDDLTSILSHKGSRISERGHYLLLQFASVLRQVQSQAGSGLKTVIRAAVHALQLDIDVVLSQSLHDDGGRLDRSSAQSSLDTFEALVDTFEAELQDGTPSTLRGFVAWVDSMGKSPDEPASDIAGHPDVVLMTIHQSKGLEWDAVAVVGMKSGTFPSNQGDGLKIEQTHPAVIDGFGRLARPASYVSTARSWMDDATAVPVPIRADAGILPRFPHDADENASTISELDRISLISLEDEVYGECRDEENTQWLSQQKEFGSRYHADERRLAYVALTRARHDVLLSYNASKNGKANGSKSNLLEDSAASNFWIESYQSFIGDPSAACFSDADLQRRAGADSGTSASATSAENPEFTGYFVGDHARDYRTAMLTALAELAQDCAEEAHESESSHSSDSEALIWPMALKPRMKSALDTSARFVLGAIDSKEKHTNDQAILDGSTPLLAQAMQVIAQRSGRLGSLHGKADDVKALRKSGLQVLSSGGQNVTALQALAGDHDEAAERRLWRGIVRPIPRMPSAAAKAGTRLHEWASAFLSAQDDFTVQQDEGVDGIATEITRQAMILELVKQRDQATTSEQRQLCDWEERLARSPWAHRSVAWVERPIVGAINDQVLKGKLDAVFNGGLNARSSDGALRSNGEQSAARYTIVDWKTGRRPVSSEDIRIKLLQLDMYRVLLSMMQGIDIGQIDACLYYVSESKPENRQIQTESRSRDEIIRDLDAGLPQISDED